MINNESEENRQKYYKERKECKKLLRFKKRKYQEEGITALKDNYKNKEIRTLYASLRKETKRDNKKLYSAKEN